MIPGNITLTWSTHIFWGATAYTPIILLHIFLQGKNSVRFAQRGVWALPMQPGKFRQMDAVISHTVRSSVWEICLMNRFTFSEKISGCCLTNRQLNRFNSLFFDFLSVSLNASRYSPAKAEFGMTALMEQIYSPRRMRKVVLLATLVEMTTSFGRSFFVLAVLALSCP